MKNHKELILARLEQILKTLKNSNNIKKTIESIEDKEAVLEVFAELINQHPELTRCLGDIISTHCKIVECFEKGNKLLLCGNGGSFADCLHISGELLKSFTRDRKLSKSDKEKYHGLPFGDIISANLEYGFKVIVLGANQSLSSAVLNDCDEAKMVFAQECQALAAKDDILLSISTSGNAENLIMAQTTAKVNGLTNISIVGRDGGKMAKNSDITIYSPGETTARIQEQQIILYHTICESVESNFFPNPRGK